jgi:uncharacterized glyoxalase superfamily protein PhnB
VTFSPLTVSLPVEDRARSYAFYRAALDLEAVGELADDGVPEPLQFCVNDGVRLMLVPRGGFGWITGGAPVADGQHECLLAVTVDDVPGVLAQAVQAGATVVTEAGEQPWGFAGAFADPDGHIWMVRGR